MLMEEFLNVMDEEMLILKKAVEESDADMITHVAHKMKGAAANMMVEDVRRPCSELQTADKTDGALVEGLCGSIDRSYKEFRGYFR